MFLKKKRPSKSYDEKSKKPVIKCSICNSEQVAGFKNIHSGAFEEIMLIRSPQELEDFKDLYGITGEIEKIY